MKKSDPSNSGVNLDKNQVEVNSKVGEFVHEQAQKWAPALRAIILLMISVVAVLSRVFSVIHYIG